MKEPTTNAGIDYACGQAINRNVETGIRFGVIPANAVDPVWFDESEANYGKPTCPKCGNECIEQNEADEESETFQPYHEHGFNEYACVNCKLLLSSDSVWGDSPQAFTYAKDGYKAEQSGDGVDIFISESPYFTYAQFCSPCAPGACYLLNPLQTDLCPICGEAITITGKTTDGRLIGSCRDAFTAEKWADKSEWSANRAYCLGHDWFEDGQAPYPVYSIATGELVTAQAQTVKG